MCGDDAEEVVQMPELFGQLWSRQNPATAQTAQAVNFRQTVRRNKLFAKMKGRRRRACEERFKIDFINEYARAEAACNLAYLFEGFIVRERARRVVQISQNNQTRARTHHARDLFRINLKIFLSSTLESLDLCAEVLRRRNKQLVSRLLYQNFIAGFYDGCHHQMISHRSACCCDDALRRDIALLGQSKL